jgi:methionine synthase I (cobalamin-dependent)
MLDSSESLPGSEPEEIVDEVMKLQSLMNISVCGGCCGTDARHIEEIVRRLNCRYA